MTDNLLCVICGNPLGLHEVGLHEFQPFHDDLPDGERAETPALIMLRRDHGVCTDPTCTAPICTYVREAEQLRSDLATARAESKENAAMVAEWDAWSLREYGITYTEMRSRAADIRAGNYLTHEQVMEHLRAASPEPIRPAGQENV